MADQDREHLMTGATIRWNGSMKTIWRDRALRENATTGPVPDPKRA